MNTIKSINPYNSEQIEEFHILNHCQINQTLQDSQAAFEHWKKVSPQDKSDLLKKVALMLDHNADLYAKHITAEMGKPIDQAISEVKKCALVCKYYANNGIDFLKDTVIETDAHKSYVSHEPLGCILAVMPWNYPFWQVFRFAAPTLMAGNVALLKHASNVMRCSKVIEDIFISAGFPQHVFQSLTIEHDQVESLIKNPIVKAVSLTGSEKAGQSVASTAGAVIKKTVLELGGSNGFIVLADADIDQAVDLAITARFQNGGQSCIAAKRFIIVESVYEEFLTKFCDKVKALQLGNPMEEKTNIGPMARPDLAESLNKIVQDSVQQGAQILLGGQYNGAMHQATVVVDVDVSMPIMQQETFGPVAPIIRSKDNHHAFEIAANTRFGLGLTICTRNIDAIEPHLSQFTDGAVFVNELVKSDPRLPFGGTGISGYGRELSKEGIMEFINKKTIFIKK